MTKLPSQMTHAAGAPVTDKINIQTADTRGPALLQDIWLIEKLAHFDRGRNITVNTIAPVATAASFE